jgi:hypothetical protein
VFVDIIQYVEGLRKEAKRGQKYHKPPHSLIFRFGLELHHQLFWVYSWPTADHYCMHQSLKINLFVYYVDSIVLFFWRALTTIEL